MEAIRRFARSFIPYNSKIYRLAAKLSDLLAVIRSDGISTWRTLSNLKNEQHSSGVAVAVLINQLQHPFYIRPATSDVGVVINNIIREEYGQVELKRSPTLMIDAGAYIGDTAAYYLSRYADLRIIALEPNPETFAIAQRNLEPYGERINLLQQGLFSDEGVRHFDGLETGVAISTVGHAVTCTTIPALIKQFSIARIDILKMDIEGAEEAIFASNPQEWLCKVDLLVVEIHGDHLVNPILGIVRGAGFSTRKYRSVWYCENALAWEQPRAQ